MTSAANTHVNLEGSRPSCSVKDKVANSILNLWTASTKRKRLYGSGLCIQVCDCYISTLVTRMLFTE